MDALYAINPGAFAQIATHISIYNQPMSEGYRNMITDVLRDTVGLWRWHKYTMWNVPGLASMLGKVAPFDVHGHFVVLDEKDIEAESRKTMYSTLRYSMLTAGQRRKEGGRRVYEFATMNFGLAVGAIVGNAWMRGGRQRFAFFDRRPIWSIGVGMVVAGLSFIGVRMTFKTIGVGTWIAENSHWKALHRIQCADCLEELVHFMDEQIEDFKHAKMPDPLPGQPPPPPEVHAKFKESMLAQGALLRKDQIAMRDHQRAILRKHGVSIEETAETRRAAKLKRLGIVEGDALPGGRVDPEVLKDESDKRHERIVEAADAAMEKLQREVPEIVRNTLVDRPLPDSCLCSVHKGLREDPEGFVHPAKWPIFPRDREVSRKRADAAERFRRAGESGSN